MRCTEIRRRVRRPAPEGAGVEVVASGSRVVPGLGVDALRRGAGIFEIDVLWGDLHIAQRGFDVGVPHQLHECRQTHTCSHHIGSKCVPKAMRISQLNASRAAMVPE